MVTEKNIEEKYIWQPRNLGYVPACMLFVASGVIPECKGMTSEYAGEYMYI